MVEGEITTGTQQYYVKTSIGRESFLHGGSTDEGKPPLVQCATQGQMFGDQRECGIVDAAPVEIRDGAEFHGSNYSGQQLVERQHMAVFCEQGLHTTGTAKFHFSYFFNVLKNVFDTLVLLQQFCSCCIADARYARNVVDLVA